MTEASYLDSDYCTYHSPSRSDRSNQRSYDQHSGPVCDVFFFSQYNAESSKGILFFCWSFCEHEKTKTPSAKKSGFCIDLWASWEEHYLRKSERGSGPSGWTAFSSKNLELFVVGAFFTNCTMVNHHETSQFRIINKNMFGVCCFPRLEDLQIQA